MYIDVDNERVVRAFAECIAETGVTELKVEDLARRLGSSRAGLYRQFGGWPQMIMFGYEATLEWVDSQLPEEGQDRRVALETWWTKLTLLLQSPFGRGALAMRALAELHYGTYGLDEFETRQLRRLTRWCDAPAAAVRATWALLRVASNPSFTAEQRLQLREIVWLILGGNGLSAETPELLALGGLL